MWDYVAEDSQPITTQQLQEQAQAIYAYACITVGGLCMKSYTAFQTQCSSLFPLHKVLVTHRGQQNDPHACVEAQNLPPANPEDDAEPAGGVLENDSAASSVSSDENCE